MSKRNIRNPQEFEGKELEGFFMVSMKDSATIISNKLTGSQVRLWLYLNMINPFAENTNDGEKIFRDIPSPQEIAIKLGLNSSTVSKDMRKLKRLGLYDFRVGNWQGFNNSGINQYGDKEV
jgi:DNA-binding MarR family transcriptional regulator